VIFLEKHAEIIFILDRSGSMNCLK